MRNHPEISATIDRYFEGLYKGDVTLLRSVFHPVAQLFGEVRGKPYHNSLDNFLAVVAGRKSPNAQGENFAMQIQEIQVVNQVAL